jgi:hypothetical protein
MSAISHVDLHGPSAATVRKKEAVILASSSRYQGGGESTPDFEVDSLGNTAKIGPCQHAGRWQVQPDRHTAAAFPKASSTIRFHHYSVPALESPVAKRQAGR